MRYGWILLAAVGALSSARGETPNVHLSGHVAGASGNYSVYITLWRREGFLEHPAEQIRVAPGAQTVFKFDVTPGWWAVSAFEDKNGNGVLDKGMFGPKEPTGFWRVFNGWHRPKFDEVAVLVEKDTANADITLK